MKESGFKLKRLDDFVAEKEREMRDNPFVRSPFSLKQEGNIVSGWTMSYRMIGMISPSFGRNFFSREDVVLITVPCTEKGIKPLVADMPFGWDGKINENTAELAVWWAFEITSVSEADEFMRTNHPCVIFSYSDSNGPGEMTVKFNGEYWEITG